MMLGELLAAKKSLRDSERCISARCIYRGTVAVNLSCSGERSGTPFRSCKLVYGFTRIACTELTRKPRRYNNACTSPKCRDNEKTTRPSTNSRATFVVLDRVVAFKRSAPFTQVRSARPVALSRVYRRSIDRSKLRLFYVWSFGQRTGYGDGNDAGRK